MIQHRHSQRPVISVKLLSIKLLLIALIILLQGCASPTPQSPKRTSQPLQSTLDLDSGSTTAASARSQFILTLSESSLYEITGGRVRTPAENLRYREFLTVLENDFGLRTVAEWSLGSVSLWCIVVESQNRFPPDQLMEKVVANKHISSVHRMQLYELLAQPSNDPHRSLQTGLSQLRAEAAHRLATGVGSRVAVIDTGVDIRHVDLAAQIAESKNMVDEDRSGFRSDIHGTVVASVIAASRNNAEGIIGIAPDAQLLAIKACWPTRPGFAGAMCSNYTLAKAIDYALGRGVDVMNLSLIGPADPLLQRLLAQALSEGVIVVGADSTDRYASFPADVDGVIAVSDGESSNSSAIVAPAFEILAARPDDGYDFFDGRSIAVAHVSGIAALVRQRRPHIGPEELLKQLKAHKLDSCRIIAQLVHAEC